MAAPAPAVRRALLLLALVLVLGLGIGAALSSALLVPSRPSVAAAGSSSALRDVQRPGAAARLQPTAAKDLDLPAAPLHRHILLAVAVAPARRRLLAYTAESLEVPGAGVPAGVAAPAAPPEGADAGREVPLPTRAASTGAGASEATSSADEADDPTAAPAPAAPLAGADEGRKVGATTCSFVTYVGGASSGAVETVQRGDGRVFVVREFAGGATNGTRGLEPPSLDDEGTDDEDSDGEEDSDEEEDTFSHYMDKFCAYVAFVKDSYDIVKAFS